MEGSRDFTILLVDSDPEVLERMALPLKEAGFQTRLSTNTKEAIEDLSSNEINAVITSLHIPEADGLELLEKTKNNNIRTPVLLLRDEEADISIPDAYDMGAEAVFTKPIDPQALIEVLKNLSVPKEIYWSRRFERLDTSLEVGLSIRHSFFPQKGQSFNVGRGGMFLVLPSRTPRLGEIVQFRISRKEEDQSPIEGHGVVRWIRSSKSKHLPKGMGIEFLGLSRDSISQLYDLLNAIKTKAFIPKS